MSLHNRISLTPIHAASFAGHDEHQTNPMKDNTPLKTIEIIQRAQDGGAIEEMSDAIREANARLTQAGKGKKAKITLEIVFENSGGNVRSVSTRVKKALPEVPKPLTLLYSGDDGRMHDSNPDQMLLKEKA